MVKVLENRVVDLDIMPGKQQDELMAEAQTQVDAAGNQIKTVAADQLSPEQKKQLEGAMDKLPEEQRSKVQSAMGGASNIVVGTAGTAGGAVKGVLDTVGDTVGTLGGGLGNTLYDAGTGLVSIPGQAVKGYKGEVPKGEANATDDVSAAAKDVESKAKSDIKSPEEGTSIEPGKKGLEVKGAEEDD
ncbi:hypothetical protein MMC25_002254 [Agyrium rufum]|nr:hypothetical protein [Agyrium rufum]